jgi:hypothetical protein
MIRLAVECPSSALGLAYRQTLKRAVESWEF